MMATVAQMSAAASRHAGFPLSRCATTARRLAESGLLPAGSGRSPPHVTVRDVARFLIALAAEPTLKDAAATVGRYWRLSHHGEPWRGDERDPITAGVALEVVLRHCATADPDGAEVPLSIEVVSSWLEITVAMTHVKASLTFHEPGANPVDRQAGAVRRAAKIPGVALARIARATLTYSSRRPS